MNNSTAGCFAVHNWASSIHLGLSSVWTSLSNDTGNQIGSECELFDRSAVNNSVGLLHLDLDSYLVSQ